MDETVKYSTIYRSVRKHLIDNLYDTEGIDISFDRKIELPYLHNKDLTRWVSVLLKDSVIDQMFEQNVEIYCCTRKDPEGIDRADLVDSVLGVFISDNGNKYTVPLYESDFETIVGYATPFPRVAQNNIPLEDETMYTLIRVVLQWAAKL
ncbi:MAG: hypothetical protein ACOC80_11015 [Petrotogales bacterium]